MPNFQKFYEYNIRVVEVDDAPWFVAKDLWKALGIRNSRHSLKRLAKSEKMPLPYKKVRKISDDPDTTRFSAVSESGMYSLIFSSRKPSAKEFRKWVCEEVLPSIRQTGHYSLGSEVALVQPSQTQAQLLATQAQWLATVAKQMADIEQAQLQHNAQQIPGKSVRITLSWFILTLLDFIWLFLTFSLIARSSWQSGTGCGLNTLFTQFDQLLQCI